MMAAPTDFSLEQVAQRLSPEVVRALRVAFAIGEQTYVKQIPIEHLFIGLSANPEGETARLLSDYHIGDTNSLIQAFIPQTSKVEQTYDLTPPEIPADEILRQSYSSELENVLRNADALRQQEEANTLQERHLLQAILSDESCQTVQWLRERGLPLDVVQERLTGSVSLWRNGTRLEVVLTQRAWRLPLDALVLPRAADFNSAGGSFYGAMLDDLDESTVDQLDKYLMTRFPKELSAESPALIELPADLGKQVFPYATDPPWILLATLGRRFSPPSQNLTVDQELAFSVNQMITNLVQRAGQENIRRVALPLIGSGPGDPDQWKPPPEMIARLQLESLLSQSDFGGLQTISIVTIAPEVLTEARLVFNRFTNNLAQAFQNDEPATVDLLGIAQEVNALTETLLLRKVHPPLAVGILGGWGSGKSSVMRLMQVKMMQIRARQVEHPWEEDESEPYVGHIYPITFNAWTYAKSDLWASLMHTTFIELDKQLSLEKLFDAEHLRRGGGNWIELNHLRPKQQQAIIETELGQEAFEKWQRGDVEGKLWAVYKEMQAAEIEKLETAKSERDQRQQELDNLETQFEEKLTNEIPQQARKNAWAKVFTQAILGPIFDEFQKQLSEDDLADLNALIAQLRQAQPTIAELWQKKSQWRADFVKRLIPMAVLGVATLLFVLIGDLVSELAKTGTVMSIFSFTGALVTGAAAAFRTYQGWQEKIDKWKIGVDDFSRVASQELTSQVDALTVEAEEQLAQDRNRLKGEIQELEVEIEKYEERIGAAGKFESVYDFVRSRLAMGDYEERLGLMHRVQADLQELTDALVMYGKEDDLHAEAKMEFFPRGPARVVLFIDDLDRCPPDKVVDVMEAVQLLLNTPLFVVVLGLDTRYVTRALEKEYKEILQHQGDPSGLDYIEKILQIPYRIRPIEPLGLRTFLSGQMEVQERNAGAPGEGAITESGSGQGQQQAAQTRGAAEEDLTGQTVEAPISTQIVAQGALPPEVVKFSQDDYDDLRICCRQVNLTPRSVKRLVNVLKLVKIYWFRTLGKDRSRTIKQTVIGFLALSACYPEIMREVFAELDTNYRDQQQLDTGLDETLQEFTLAGDQQAIFAWQIKRFQNDVKALGNVKTEPNQPPAEFFKLKLRELPLTTFNLVRSFSFVGDPSYAIDQQRKTLMPLAPLLPPGATLLAEGVWQCPDSLAGVAYVGRDSSDKFHLPSCRWAEKIPGEQRIGFASKEAAIAYGYTPCRVCNA